MTKINLISAFAILFLIPQVIFSQEKIDFITLNDSTIFCSKNDTVFLLQFRKGKIVDKQKFLSFFNVEEKEDTLQWNDVVEDIVEKQINPTVSIFVLYNATNNPDASFDWYIQNDYEINHFKSTKTTNETNFFKVDAIISFIAGKDITFDSIIYKNILLSISGYSGQTAKWKSIRDSLRDKLNLENYQFKLIKYSDENGTTQNIFIHKIKDLGDLPIYNYTSTPKTFKSQPQTDDTENEPIDDLRFLYSLLSGVIITILFLTIFYLLFRKKINALLISKKSIKHIDGILPSMLEKRESVLKPVFDNLYIEFKQKFEIYHDVSNKLNVQNSVTNEEAFQYFLKTEMKEVLSDKNNIKELLETDNISDLKNSLNAVESTFAKLTNIEKFDFNKKEQADLPEKIKALIDKISCAESTFKKIADLEKLDFNDEKFTELPNKIQKLIDEISVKEQKIETLTKDKDGKQQQIIDLKNEKIRLEDELAIEVKNIERYNRFHKQLQKKINTIRKLDNLFERKGANKRNSNDEKNNIILSTLQLRSLLNLFYCSLSENKEQYQIDNLRNLNKDNDDEIEMLLDEIENTLKDNTDLNFKIEKGDYNNSSSLYQLFVKIFNKDIDTLPKPYYFGIEDDKHNKSKN
jgi:hypothetical protein